MYESFRAEDGRPLVEVLREAVLAVRATGLSVRVWTPARRRAILAGVGWAALGRARPGVARGGHDLLPARRARAGHVRLRRPQRVPAVAAGRGAVGGGLWRTACAFLPALAAWERRNSTLVTLAGAVAWGLLIWATWRG